MLAMIAFPLSEFYIGFRQGRADDIFLHSLCVGLDSIRIEGDDRTFRVVTSCRELHAEAEPYLCLELLDLEWWTYLDAIALTMQRSPFTIVLG
jgi:hypothetical protein